MAQNAFKRQVSLDDERAEDEDEGSVGENGWQGAQMSVAILNSGKKACCHDNVDGNLSERVADWIFLLSDEIREKHCRSVTCHASPGASHVAGARDEQEIDCEQHQAPGSGEKRPPESLVCELVPE